MPEVHKVKLIIVQPLLEAIATLTPGPGTSLCSKLLFLSVMITFERELWSTTSTLPALSMKRPSNQ